MVGLFGFAGECVWFTSCGLVFCFFAGFGNVLRAACPLQLGWLLVGFGWWLAYLWLVGGVLGCLWFCLRDVPGSVGFVVCFVLLVVLLPVELILWWCRWFDCRFVGLGFAVAVV